MAKLLAPDFAKHSFPAPKITKTAVIYISSRRIGKHNYIIGRPTNIEKNKMLRNQPLLNEKHV